MRLVVLMSFYVESPDRLRGCVKNAHDLGATDVIFCDGAYALFPDATRSSGQYPREMLQNVTLRMGMGALFYTPNDVWHGNEVEKRQTMLDLALAITTDEDWLCPYDADFKLESEPVDLKPILAEHDARWGDIELTDSTADDGWYPVRLLWRAVRGMHFTTNHYRTHYPDGDHTVVGPTGSDVHRGFKLPVKIRHNPERPDQPGRRDQQRIYYERREATQAET